MFCFQGEGSGRKDTLLSKRKVCVDCSFINPKQTIMKKIISFAIVMTLLTGIIALAYLMPTVFPESMKSFVLNSETLLISSGGITGVSWILILVTNVG